MIGRRQFNVAAVVPLALGCGLSASRVSAQPGVRTMRLGNPSGLNDAQQCFITCGRHPRLNYYKPEGVDVEYVNMSNVSQSMQTVITGETNLATVVPIIFFLQAAKEPNLGVVAPYSWLPRNVSVLAVKPDSPYRSVSDLKGKRFGIRNQGDAGTIVIKSMFKELGLDDSANVFIPVGDGGPAGTALQQDRVDALISFDTAAARVELAGFALRYLPLTPGMQALSGAWYGVSKKDLQANRKAYVGLFRGMAKSMLFAHTNLEQAIRLHWELYPESKPRSKSEQDGLQEVKAILAMRRDNWMRNPGDPDQRIGAIDPEDAKVHLALASDLAKNPQLESKLGALKDWYTNELIDEINTFDKNAIIQQAKTFVAGQ